MAHLSFVLPLGEWYTTIIISAGVFGPEGGEGAKLIFSINGQREKQWLHYRVPSATTF